MENYKVFDESAIENEYKNNPQRAIMMLASNITMGDAKLKESGLRKHNVETYNEGWFLTIDTPKGVVGLWSCWLANRLVVCFPYSICINDADVERILGVKNLNDSDYPKHKRKWAKFCSERINGDKGRVFIDYNNFDSYSYSFPLVKGKKLEEVYYGHKSSYTISTSPFSFFSEEDIDAPNAKIEEIIKYKDKFIELFIFVAEQMGGIKSAAIRYQNLIFVPEELSVEGYTNIEWIKGNPGIRRGWGNELVYANKGSEEIILESANSLVPWVCTRQINKENIQIEDIIALLTI